MRLYALKVNHLTNPLGFRMERTVFSWKVADAAGGKQTATRIIVCSDHKMNHPLIDTGFDPAADSLAWNVEIPLAPRTRYWWTVTVRTDAGEECTSEPQWFETGKMSEPWSGRWITCDNSESRHPVFQKTITPQKKIDSARLYICGLGLYEADYNGMRIGCEYLTPYCTDYNQWVQYQTYDMTEQLQQKGTLSILLGNGWYKARFGFSAKENIGFYGSEWKLLAELHIQYADGTKEVIGTDETWMVQRSSITFSNLYDGEHRDDTLSVLPAVHAVRCMPPKGVLTDRMSLPVTIQKEITPTALIHTPAGELVYDLGQEITGTFRLHLAVPQGTRVHIQTGEVLQNGNFYNGNLRSAKSEYIYVSNGEEVTVVPKFTFYGYRYAKISGTMDLRLEDFTGLAMWSNFEETGELHTGNPLVNQLISNVRWGMRDNFLDVPTNCPQRDERMGWTGDAQAFSPTATYLADTYAFYAKYLYDMAQEQAENDGMVPDVIPSFGIKSTASVWGDAACIIPWNLYCSYGDKSILEDQFASMRAWVDYIRREDGQDHNWRDRFHYGDWLALDNPISGEDQVLGGTDEDFIASLYYAVSTGLVAKAAAILNLPELEAEYQILSEQQYDEIRKEYFSPSGRCCIKTQTALLLTLKYHLSSNEGSIKSQLQKLFLDNQNKLQTGFVGTPILCPVLSENGMSSLAYHLLLNEAYPGWLHEVKLGATTVWERWNSLDDAGRISSTGMNSLNHYAYGSIAEWLFRYAGGIQPLEPGFRKVRFAPELNWKLREFTASYDSPTGRYVSSWKFADERHVLCRFAVPFGGTGEAALPNSGGIVETLSAGTYEFVYELKGYVVDSLSCDSSIAEILCEPGGIAAVKKWFDITLVPAHYRRYSIRELYQMGFLTMTDAAFQMIDAALEEING